MATISRRLLPPNKKKEQKLIFVIQHGRDIRLDYSSGIRLPSAYWTDQKLAGRDYEEYETVNIQIHSMEAKIQVVINQLILNGEVITKDLVKEKLDDAFQRLNTSPKTNNRNPTFFGFCDQYLRYAKSIKRRSTILSYNHSVRVLKEFNPRLDFDDITTTFYSEFVAYLREEYQLLDNSIGKDIKNLKAILNEATEQGYNTNFDYRSKRFRTLKYEADTIHLSRSELSEIYALDLTKRKGLERVRDLFLIGCYTGLRFSDLNELSIENIITREDRQYINIRTQKTGKRVMIPVNSVVSELLDKYDGNIPKAISNQKMNVALKEICRLAGLTDLIQVTKTRAGILEKHVLPKYKLVTTHTARRSFATNAYLSGVPSLAIMKITGHKSESSFMKYIKGSQEENATALSKHPFFT